MKRFEDPHDPLNGVQYRTGNPCVEPGCDRPAGTAWSRYWCQPCNALRMNGINLSFARMVAEAKGKQ